MLAGTLTRNRRFGGFCWLSGAGFWGFLCFSLFNAGGVTRNVLGIMR